MDLTLALALTLTLSQELLSLSGPELLASMGLGGEEEGESPAPLPPGVSIDAVEMVRPLLKIKVRPASSNPNP